MLQGPTSDTLDATIHPKSGRYNPTHDIVICPASGINDSNITSLKSRLGKMEEAHLSGGHLVPARQTRSTTMGEELGFGCAEWKLDEVKVERVWNIVKDW